MGSHTEQMIEEAEFAAFLREILDRLDGPARGITLQVIDQGTDSLSAKQKRVFEKYVLDPYTLDECSVCLNSIPLSEMAFALDHRGMCSWCYNRWQKMLAE